MDDNLVDLYARLTLHELILEIVAANVLSDRGRMDIGEFDELCGGLVARSKSANMSEPLNEIETDFAFAIQTRIAEMLRRFFEKIRAQVYATEAE